MTDKEKQKHIDAFKYWCETNEECGVITIPKFVCDNIIKILDNAPKVEIPTGECIDRNGNTTYPFWLRYGRMSDYENRREDRLIDTMAVLVRNTRTLQNIVRNAYDIGYADGRKFGKKETEVKLLVDGEQLYPREEKNSEIR